MKDRIKRLRKERKLNQEKFGEALGVATSTIGSWESGARSIPKARVFQICQIFNVRQDWLERGVGSMTPQAENAENEAEARLFERVARLTTEQKNAVADFIDAFL